MLDLFKCNIWLTWFIYSFVNMNNILMWDLIVMWVKHSWPRHPKPSKMPKSQELWGLCPLWPPPGLCPRPTRGPYAAPLTPGENVQRSFKSMSTLFCCACWYSWCNFVCSFEISNACFPSYWFNWFLASECSDIGLMSELCYMFFSLMWRTPHLPNRKYHKWEGFSFKNYWRLLQQKRTVVELVIIILPYDIFDVGVISMVSDCPVYSVCMLHSGHVMLMLYLLTSINVIVKQTQKK